MAHFTCPWLGTPPRTYVSVTLFIHIQRAPRRRTSHTNFYQLFYCSFFPWVQCFQGQVPQLTDDYRDVSIVWVPCAHDLTDGGRRRHLSGRQHSRSLHFTLRSQLCVSSALPRGYCQPFFLLISILRMSQALLALAESASLTLIYARLRPPAWLCHPHPKGLWAETFLTVQWLRLHTSHAGMLGMYVRSPVRELRFYVLTK